MWVSQKQANKIQFGRPLTKDEIRKQKEEKYKANKAKMTDKQRLDVIEEILGL